MCVHVGDSLPSVAASRDSFQRAFDPLEEVAHKGLEAAAAATRGLAYHDPAPLHDPARLPTSEASASYLSALKYHQLVKKEGDLSVLAPTHVDGGLLTVVHTTQPGLQVRGFGAGGQWIDVPPATDDQWRFVVLVGGQLERATGGALKPVEHRVVKINAPNNAPRLALVFRLRARHTAILDPMKLANKITLPMPLLASPAIRAPISVADFEAAFKQNQPSITYGHRWGTTVQIFLKSLTDKAVTLSVDPDEDVATVKTLI